LDLIYQTLLKSTNSTDSGPNPNALVDPPQWQDQSLLEAKSASANSPDHPRDPHLDNESGLVQAPVFPLLTERQRGSVNYSENKKKQWQHNKQRRHAVFTMSLNSTITWFPSEAANGE
jgi:hypothetical protein